MSNRLMSPKAIDMLSNNGKSQFVYNTNDLNLVKLDKAVSNNIKSVKESLEIKSQLQNSIKSYTKQVKMVEEPEIAKLRVKQEQITQQIN
jgi:hypothetical protein